MAAEAALAKCAADAVKQDIAAGYGALMNGYMKADWKVTSQIYGPNCVIMSPGKPTIKGKLGAEKYWRELKEETGITKISIKCDELNGKGDWWFERGVYTLFKGDNVFEERKYIKIWRKWEGKYLIYSYIFNILPKN